MATRIEVMGYNLLYAFHDRKGRTMVHHADREQAAREVIESVSPDILALTEAVRLDARGRPEHPPYRHWFGLPHMAVACYPGDWGSCLLSRYPIVRAERRPLGVSPRGVQMPALRATLAIAGREVHVDVVHPSPHVAESARVEAFRPLLSPRPSPYLLLGDFNALSDEDPYDAATLAGQMAGLVDDPPALAARMLDRQLIGSIRAAGLRDVLPPERRTHSIPTTLSRPHATQGARLRIDYVFASPEFRVVDSVIFKSPATERASDHYPIVATLDLD